MASVTVNQERRMRVAIERIVGFAQEFGEVHLNLACHAAFPLALTPDLLYQLWANFVPEAPWTAVARVLLSRLCQQVGYEMYEMDLEVRNLLLRELKEQFGSERLKDLAEFLLEYVGQKLTEDDLDTQDLRESQEWTALAYTEPTEAAHKLAKALSARVTQDEMAELFRLSSLVETLGEPLVEAGFEPLLVYSRGLESFVRGDLKSATSQLGELLLPNRPVEVAGVTLPIPQQIASELEQPEPELEQPEPEPQPVSPTTSRKLCSTFIIAIGGTGAKCVESIIHLAAAGLFPEEPIGVLFVDADETNGNLERARTSLSIYQKSYELMSGGDKQQCPWLKTPIESFDLWSPFAGLSLNKELKGFFNYNTIKQNQPALSNLFDVLYTKNEQEVSLDVGFRGRPAIGAAVMSQVDLERLEQEPWGTFIKQIQADVSSGKAAKVFLCGSIFGGTGASGLSTLGRLIANKLNRINVKERVKIGCLFLLPYFGFSPPPGEAPDGVYARTEQFLLNTEAALRYYVTQAQEIFDTVYLLGNQNFSRVKFSFGKNSQRNEPHFLELLAGLAVRHFLLHTPTVEGKVVLISREREKRLTWNDIPERLEVKPALVNGTRFAYTWLAEIEPELAQLQKRSSSRSVLAPWLLKFFSTNGRNRQQSMEQLSAPSEQEAIKIISIWCQDYLRWLHDLHQCEGETIQLFVPGTFANPEGQLKQEQLAELVFEENPDARSKSRDTIGKLKRSLQDYQVTPAERGIVGLANTLYVLCRT